MATSKTNEKPRLSKWIQSRKEKHTFSIKLLKHTRIHHRRQEMILRKHLKKTVHFLPKSITKRSAKILAWHQGILADLDTAIAKLKK